MVIKIKYQTNERYNMKKDVLLQQQNDRYIQFKEFVKTYIELDNRIKALEEKEDKNIF